MLTSNLRKGTALTEEDDVARAFYLGADDYIRKPYTSRELHARVKAVLRRTEIADLFERAGISVNLARQEVRRSGTTVDLTAIEYRILVALIRARGRILTREAVINAVWGRGSDVSDRAVDNHILNLRKKLERSPNSPELILSVRGFGYKIAH